MDDSFFAFCSDKIAKQLPFCFCEILNYQWKLMINICVCTYMWSAGKALISINVMMEVTITHYLNAGRDT